MSVSLAWSEQRWSPPSNLALQRTRGLAAAQLLRSAGRFSAAQPLPGGRSPLNARSLGNLNWLGPIGLLLLVSWNVACSTSPPVKVPVAPAQLAPAARPALMLRRQPGGMIISEGSMNFWTVQISEDGSAILAAQGTPLIANGRYAGIIAPDLFELVRSRADQIRTTPATIRICPHASDFQIYLFHVDIFRNACISEISDSNLAELYRASERVIRETPWAVVHEAPAP